MLFFYCKKVKKSSIMRKFPQSGHPAGRIGRIFAYWAVVYFVQFWGWDYRRTCRAQIYVLLVSTVICSYICTYFKKEVARGGERTRVLLISFIFSFSPLYRWASAAPHICTDYFWLNLTNKMFGQRFGRFFHELIWSPCATHCKLGTLQLLFKSAITKVS
jgi:hypothetical protein